MVLAAAVRAFFSAVDRNSWDFCRYWRHPAGTSGSTCRLRSPSSVFFAYSISPRNLGCLISSCVGKDQVVVLPSTWGWISPSPVRRGNIQLDRRVAPRRYHCIGRFRDRSMPRAAAEPCNCTAIANTSGNQNSDWFFHFSSLSQQLGLGPLSKCDDPPAPHR